MSRFAAAFLFTILLSACDKDGTADKNQWIKGAKPGWTEQAARDFIACEPMEGKVCQCIIGKITKKYTPTQVREKSPLVAADMISARQSCGGSAVSQPIMGEETPKPKPPVFPREPREIRP